MKEQSTHQHQYCLNCHYPLPEQAAYCHKCSQKVTDGRITFGEMLSEFAGAVFNFDSRFFQTVGALFIPGKLTTEYFKGRHRRFVHPLRVFLVMTIGMIAAATFSIDDPDFMDLQRDLDREKSKSHRYEYLVELDSLKDQTSDQFATNITTAALDTLFKKVMHGEKELNQDSTNLFSLDNLNFSKNVKIAVNDLLELETAEILELYQIKGTANRFMVAQHIRLRKKGTNFGNYLLGNIVWMVFLMMPFLALILKLLYIRRKYYYVEHLVFSFHAHAFAFAVYTFMILFGHHNEGWIIGGGFILLAFYLYKALRRVYGQGRFKTLLKYIFMGVSYIFLLLISVIFTFVLSFLLF